MHSQLKRVYILFAFNLVVKKEDRVTKVEKGDYEEQGNVDDRRKRLVSNR